MAAIGWPRPLWSIDAKNCITQKTLSPSPIPPSAPPPPPRIMPPWWAELADAKKRPIRCGGCRYDGLEAGHHGRGVCVKLANLPSKNTHPKQINRPNQFCTNDIIFAGTGDQDKNWYAGSPQDQLLSGNTISPLLVWVSHATVAGVWSTNSYLKYEFVPADRISMTVPSENKSPGKLFFFIKNSSSMPYVLLHPRSNTTIRPKNVSG